MKSTVQHLEVVKSKEGRLPDPSTTPISDEQKIGVLSAEVERLTGIMQDAENCLVCSVIGDPREVCLNTLDILRSRKEQSPSV